MTKDNYKIQNIVATTSLEKPVPLIKLARTCLACTVITIRGGNEYHANIPTIIPICNHIFVLQYIYQPKPYKAFLYFV